EEKDTAPARRHAIEDVGLGRADGRADESHPERNAQRAAEHLTEIFVGEEVPPVLEDVDRLDALHGAEIVEREERGHPERDDEDRGEEEQRRSGEKVRPHHARRTASPSAGPAAPSFCRITVTSPLAVSTW